MIQLFGAIVRGLRSRALLSAGSVLLTALAIGSAVLGPVFSEAVTNSYVVTRLQETAPGLTGLSRVFTPDTGSSIEQAEQDAVAASRERTTGPWQEPSVIAQSERFSALRGVVTFWSRPGACDALEVEGRCPEQRGEVLMLTGDLDKTGAEIGEPLELAIYETPGTQELGLPRPGLDEVVVVGTYDTPATAEDWLIPGRLTSTNEQTSIRGGYQPYAPAPLITTDDTVEAMGAWTVRVDTRLDVPADLTPAELNEAAESAASVAGDTPDRGRGRHPRLRRHQRPRHRGRGGPLPAVHRAQLDRPGRPVAGPGRPGPADAPAQRRQRAARPRARARLAARGHRTPAVGPRPRRAAHPAPGGHAPRCRHRPGALGHAGPQLAGARAPAAAADRQLDRRRAGAGGGLRRRVRRRGAGGPRVARLPAQRRTTSGGRAPLVGHRPADPGRPRRRRAGQQAVGRRSRRARRHRPRAAGAAGGGGRPRRDEADRRARHLVDRPVAEPLAQRLRLLARDLAPAGGHAGDPADHRGDRRGRLRGRRLRLRRHLAHQRRGHRVAGDDHLVHHAEPPGGRRAHPPHRPRGRVDHGGRERHQPRRQLLRRRQQPAGAGRRLAAHVEPRARRGAGRRGHRARRCRPDRRGPPDQPHDRQPRRHGRRPVGRAAVRHARGSAAQGLPRPVPARREHPIGTAAEVRRRLPAARA